MIVRIVKLTFEPQHVPDFLRLFEEVSPDIRRFPGCLSLDLFNNIDDNTVFFTYSTWNSPGELDSYRFSPLFRTIWSKTKVLFSSPAEAWSLTKNVGNSNVKFSRRVD
jgi:quinol monooxygenase YgiN